MAITVLAVAFLIIIGFIAIIGYSSVIRRSNYPETLNNEKCAICRESFDKKELVERQIGDYKLLYFCRKCILQLYTDLGLKN